MISKFHKSLCINHYFFVNSLENFVKGPGKYSYGPHIVLTEHLDTDLISSFVQFLLCLFV